MCVIKLAFLEVSLTKKKARNTVSFDLLVGSSYNISLYDMISDGLGTINTRPGHPPGGIYAVPARTM